jgi:hypothetical protein
MALNVQSRFGVDSVGDAMQEESRLAGNWLRDIEGTVGHFQELGVARVDAAS